LAASGPDRRIPVDSQFDALTKLAARSSLRRDVFRGLGGLALGAVGIHALTGSENDAEAKKNNHRCKNCKQKCRRKNKKKNNKNKQNCGNKCNNKCR
jgi:hypothetical protein